MKAKRERSFAPADLLSRICFFALSPSSLITFFYKPQPHFFFLRLIKTTPFLALSLQAMEMSYRMKKNRADMQMEFNAFWMETATNLASKTPLALSCFVT